VGKLDSALSFGGRRNGHHFGSDKGDLCLESFAATQNQEVDH
jgi:hypothetical protein